MPYKIKQNFHKQFEHLKDIHFHTSSTDVSLLIGAVMRKLHLTNKIRKGNKNEAIEIKLVLAWVFSGILTLSQGRCKSFLKKHRNKMMKMMKFLIIVYFHSTMNYKSIFFSQQFK